MALYKHCQGAARAKVVALAPEYIRGYGESYHNFAEAVWPHVH